MCSSKYSFRFYRDWMRGENLSRIRMVHGESDLLILCSGDLEHLADVLLASARRDIGEAISTVPGFRDSLAPISPGIRPSPLAESMILASSAWDVGPMASVAGAVAHYVASGLREFSRTVIVENGGDTYAYADGPLTFSVYPGEDSPFPDAFGFTVDASNGISVCTSSGKVGPSWSAGLADAVVAVASDGATADAAATSVGNRISSPGDVRPEIGSISISDGLTGVIAMAGSQMGIWGNLELGAVERGA